LTEWVAVRVLGVANEAKLTGHLIS